MAQGCWTFIEGLEDTHSLGQEMGQCLLRSPKVPRLIAAIGNVGAGKTSLAQGLARGLGVPQTVYVNSPTFALHQAHQGELLFHHLDLYRLADEEELLHLGFEDLFERGVCYIEWPQRAPSLFRSTPHFTLGLFHPDEWSKLLPSLALGLPDQGRIIVLLAESHTSDILASEDRWKTMSSEDTSKVVEHLSHDHLS